MLGDDRPDDDDDPAEEPPPEDEDDPPDPPPPDGRDTAVPLDPLLPLDGRDSGRSLACPASAGAMLKENAAAAAQKVVARRVMLSSRKKWLSPIMVTQSLGFHQTKKQCTCQPQSSVTH